MLTTIYVQKSHCFLLILITLKLWNNQTQEIQPITVIKFCICYKLDPIKQKLTLSSVQLSCTEQFSTLCDEVNDVIRG